MLYTLKLLLLFSKTSNVTGRHRGPKRKLRVDYRALSLQSPSHFSSSVVSRAFSALCMYSKFGQSQIRFSLAHREKSLTQLITQSLTQLIWWPGNRSACASEQECWMTLNLDALCQLLMTLTLTLTLAAVLKPCRFFPLIWYGTTRYDNV